MGPNDAEMQTSASPRRQICLIASLSSRLAAAETWICRFASRTTCRQQLHEIPLRLVTAHEIMEIGYVLLGLADSLPKPSHAFEQAAGRFIVAGTAEPNHLFNTVGVDLQHFGGMTLFARFGEFPEQIFGAAMIL